MKKSGRWKDRQKKERDKRRAGKKRIGIYRQASRRRKRWTKDNKDRQAVKTWSDGHRDRDEREDEG